MQTNHSSLMPLWSECVQDYLWPKEVQSALADVGDLNFDCSHLLKLANENSESGPFVLTFLTSELFPLGILWTQFARRAGIKRFAIAAMDTETVSGLQKLAIPVIEVHLPECLTRMVHYQNRNDFNGKALALIYCRGQLVKFLLKNGIDVVSCDVDALFEKPFDLQLMRGQSIAFQRVAFLPKPLARVWGFTACAGFVAYSANSNVVSFLSRVLALQQEVSSDQVALNLALLEHNVKWDTECVGFKSQDDVISDFSVNAARSIHGVLPKTEITLTALPATTFWRHKFVPLDRNVTVVLHPNSPKPIEGKLEIFSQILNSCELGLLSDELIRDY